MAKNSMPLHPLDAMVAKVNAEPDPAKTMPTPKQMMMDPAEVAAGMPPC